MRKGIYVLITTLLPIGIFISTGCQQITLQMTGEDIINRCTQTMSKVNSFHFKEVIDVDSKQYGTTAMTLHTTTIGDFSRPDRIQATVERNGTREGEAWIGGTMTVGRVGYTGHQQTGGWYSTPGVFWNDVLYLDPLQIIDDFLKLKPELERLPGIACYHFRGNGIVHNDINISAQFEVWIGQTSFLISQINIEGNIPVNEGGGMFSVTVELSDFD